MLATLFALDMLCYVSKTGNPFLSSVHCRRLSNNGNKPTYDEVAGDGERRHVGNVGVELLLLMLLVLFILVT